LLRGSGRGKGGSWVSVGLLMRPRKQEREKTGNRTHTQHSGYNSGIERVRIGEAGGKGGRWAKKWQSGRVFVADFVRGFTILEGGWFECRVSIEN